MKNYIINSFILHDNNTLTDIHNYIKFRYNNSVELNDINTELSKLTKNNIIVSHNKIYKLSNEGNVILNDQKYYYSKIIINFYKRYIKKNIKNIKYELSEVRPEQKQLRNYLVSNKKQICIICEKKLPLILLEAAHLKPRNILNNSEKNDKNIVEFMCRYCHTLYDDGSLAVYKGLLQVSTSIDNYDLHYDNNKQIPYYNLQNEKYFMYHYNHIYKMDVNYKKY
jgi:hypothetical protein